MIVCDSASQMLLSRFGSFFLVPEGEKEKEMAQNVPVKNDDMGTSQIVGC